MTQTYTKLLVTKLSQGTHDTLIELARKERRSLSGMSRVIIEDYFDELNKDQVSNQD
jgi:hypothetical protein